MRLRAAVPLLLLALAAGALPARAADAPWLAHLLAGREAFARDDRASTRAEFRAVDSLVGGHTGAKAVLAVLAARDGQRDIALTWLRALADARLTRPSLVDTAFALWGAEPEFAAVAARFTANAAPIAAAAVMSSLGDASLLAEDVTWDATARRFLVSSIHREKIVAVDSAGRVRDFTAPGAGGAWGVYGLALDARRGLLWASTAAGPECERYVPADSGRTALIAYDLRTARLVRRVELPRTPERQVLGDLALAPDGTVFASESLHGAVYRLRPGVRRLEAIVPRGTFRSPQQPALAAGGRRLYVPDYARGIAAVDLGSGAVRWLAKPYALASGGIDGLVRAGNRLLAVQNGAAPHRVLALTLDARGDAITAWRVLEQGSPRLGEPNHGVVVGRDFWMIGDSGWDRVDDDGVLHTTADAHPPVLLRLPLERPR